MVKGDRAWAWAAGLFEGEGSVSLIRKPCGRPSVQFSLTSTDRDVIDRFVSIVGVGKIYGPYQRKKATYKPQFTWRAHGWAILRFLDGRFSPMLGRRRRAKITQLLQLEPPKYEPPPRPTRKLSVDGVREILRRLSNRESQHSIAASFGVSQTVISDIKLGRIYREITNAFSDSNKIRCKAGMRVEEARTLFDV